MVFPLNPALKNRGRLQVAASFQGAKSWPDALRGSGQAGCISFRKYIGTDGLTLLTSNF